MTTMTKSPLPLLLVSAVVLSGCGKKKEEAPAAATPAAQTSHPSSGQSTNAYAGAMEKTKETVQAVTAGAVKAGEQIVEQTTEQAKAAATQVQAQATAAVDSFTAQINESVAKAVDSAKNLLSNPQVTEPMKAELTKLIDGVMNKEDGASAAALNKIVALKPSDEQMAVVKELQSNLGVLVLGRNFDANDPASGGVVKQTIDALKAKDTTAIMSGLQNLASQTKFTAAQKDMLGNLLGSYNAKLAGAMDSVNKASETLKGFGL